MRRFRRPLRSLFLVAAIATAATACASPVDLDSQTGTVQWFDLEGGFFAIRGDDGEVYDPINLPAEFREDGLRVRFDAEIRRDLGSIHMVGQIVEIHSIERLDE